MTFSARYCVDTADTKGRAGIVV